MHTGLHLKVTIPTVALSPGSLKLETIDARVLTAWTNEHYAEAHQLLQKIAAIWQARDAVYDYAVYTRHSDDLASYGWEVVPFPAQSKGLWDKLKAYWQQLKILWRAVYGGSVISAVERATLAASYHNYQPLFEKTLPLQVKETSSIIHQDVFCRPIVIAKQAIFSGQYTPSTSKEGWGLWRRPYPSFEVEGVYTDRSSKSGCELRSVYTYVLYDNAPTPGSADKLHFLFIPKEHRSDFGTLTSEEFQEASRLAQALTTYYAGEGHPTSYHFHKTGAHAGQSVLHWHQHLILTNPSDERWAKICTIARLILGKKALPALEFETRVAHLRDKLTPVLQSSL